MGARQSDVGRVADDWPSASHLVAGLAFASAARFSDPIAFVDALFNEAGIAEDERGSAAIDQIEGFVREWADLESVIQGGLDGLRAFRHVLARDAAAALKLASKIETRLLQPASIESAMKQLRDAAAHRGLDVDYARQRVVDQFPQPYADTNFAAMTYDRGDQRLYGIEPGVVLLRNQLRPLYSIGLLAHEFVHLIIGRIDTDVLARGLEEGLADFFGQLVLAGRIMPRAICERLLWNSRSRYGRPQLGRLYRDALLATCVVYLEIGDEGFEALLRRANHEGRHVVKDLEREVCLGTLRGSRGRSDEYRGFAQSFVAMTPDLVVTPLAMLLAESLSVGQSVDAAAQALRLERSLVQPALNELQTRVFLTVESEDTVSSTEGGFYAALGHLRYDAQNPLEWLDHD